MPKVNSISYVMLMAIIDLTITKIVLVIVLIFALIYIFKYGAVLQQESDETL